MFRQSVPRPACFEKSLGSLSFRRHFFGLLFSLFDRTDIHKSIFWQMVPLTITEFLETANGILQRRKFARLSGEDFGHKERLGKEPLNSSCSVNNQLVLLRKLIDAQNRNDVLKFTISLQSRLDAAGDN